MIWLVVWRTSVNRVAHRRTPQTARKSGFSNRWRLLAVSVVILLLGPACSHHMTYIEAPTQTPPCRCNRQQDTERLQHLIFPITRGFSRPCPIQCLDFTFSVLFPYTHPPESNRDDR